MALPSTQRRIVIAKRPQGAPREDDFRVENAPLPEVGPFQVLVRSIYLSLDPYLRGVMNEGGALGFSASLGEPMRGGVVGEVVRSNHPDFALGDIVEDILGWEEYTVGPRGLMRRVDPIVAPISTANSILGMTGMTAYFGLFEYAETKPGETVVVSGASGGVGQVTIQLAKIMNCRAVGIAGGPEKCRFLTEDLGADAAVDYKTGGDLSAKIKAVCPQGVDVYIDMTGGPISDSVMEAMNLYGRIIVVGRSAHTSDPNSRLLGRFVSKRLTARGFIIFDRRAQWEPAIRIMGDWVRGGRLRYRDHIVEGLEHAPRAFGDMLAGKLFGKPQVRVGQDPFATGTLAKDWPAS